VTKVFQFGDPHSGSGRAAYEFFTTRSFRRCWNSGSLADVVSNLWAYPGNELGLRIYRGWV